MLKRVKDTIEAGTEVRIFTARAMNADGIATVRKWLKANDLAGLPVTHQPARLQPQLHPLHRQPAELRDAHPRQDQRSHPVVVPLRQRVPQSAGPTQQP